MWVLSFAKSSGQFRLFWTEGYLPYFKTCVLISCLSLQFFFFFRPRFQFDGGESVCLLSYISPSPLSVCACPQTQHIKSWPPCTGREGTTEKISPHRCASPPLHSLSLNQPLFSFFFPPPSLPSLFYSRSAHRSQALPMHALQQNPYTFTQPTGGLLFDYSQTPHVL